MSQALLDEEQVEVGAAVEVLRGQQRASRRRDILEAHIGRIADDGVEALAYRIGEKIHVERRLGTVRRIELDPHHAPLAIQMPQKGAVSTGWLEHPATVAAQRQHRPDHRLGGEDLAEAFNFAARQG